MIEPYVRGLELAVAVMDGKALTVTEIVPRTGFYDYDAKYGEGGSSHVLPARISEAVAERCKRFAEDGARRAWLSRSYPEATFVMTTLTRFWSCWR